MVSFTGVLVRVPMIAAFAAMVVLSTSCAVLFSGTSQTVSVTSEPPQAEVFVDGVSAGFTPLELDLERGRDHTVVVRLRGQEQTVVLRSGTQTVPVVLDLVPVVLFGANLVAMYAGEFFHHAPLEPVMWGLVAVSFAPLLVDASTGALQQLTPGEIIVAFDGP